MLIDGIDHVVIHVDDWEAAHAFYIGVLGLERVENPEANGNPLDAASYRAGRQQINAHGPWPGQTNACCPPPLNEVGRADLAFRTQLSTESVLDHLRAASVDVVSGPIPRFGADGWGSSVYCHDPSGNGIEIISYAP